MNDSMTRHVSATLETRLTGLTRLDDARVVVVDDVADSGKTLELVRDFCHGHMAEARSAVLDQKPTSLVADFGWHRTDRWIDFPWSTEL